MQPPSSQPSSATVVTQGTPLPRPALVAREAAARLPRLALWALTAAYLLPGLWGRDPWRSGELVSFAHMLALAQGRAPWLEPSLAGLAGDVALLPHWLGAAAILLLQPLGVEASLAARLPFALLLLLALAGTWYGAFRLALSEPAQPLPFAFGGEADPVAYARAMADAALLALFATLGLLQRGHETTPELAQMAAAAWVFWAVADGRGARAGVAAALGLMALSASGAPTVATLLTLVLVGLSLAPRVGVGREMAAWLALGGLLGAAIAFPVHGWGLRLGEWPGLPSLLRQWAWFLWPAWPLALWTLWRWRRHLGARHVALPGVMFGAAWLASVWMGGQDKALLLGLPGLAVLAAFALPTLRRSTLAAVDWFSVMFFTLAALAIWVVYLAMHTGLPAKPAANIARLAEGFVPSFSAGALAAAVLASLAWGWLVRWRTGRHRSALWKSLVLPAGGVALCWLLLMTLWLPLLDYARSNRALVARLLPHLPAAACIAAPQAPAAVLAALETHGRLTLDARPEAVARCPVQLLVLRGEAQALSADPERLQALAQGWRETARVRRPTERREWTLVLQRP